MSLKNVNVTRGLDAKFDEKVDATNKLMSEYISRVTVSNTVGLKILGRFKTTTPGVSIFVEARPTANNGLSLLLALNKTDIVGISSSGYGDQQNVIRYLQEVEYIEKGQFSIPTRINYQETEADKETVFVNIALIKTQASKINQLALKLLLGSARVTDYHHNAMMCIRINDRPMSDTGGFYNSNVYRMTKNMTSLEESTVPVYQADIVKLDDVLDAKSIYIRHQLIRNELIIYSESTEAALDIIKFLETAGKSSFFIHKHFKSKADTSQSGFRICPLLDQPSPV